MATNYTVLPSETRPVARKPDTSNDRSITSVDPGNNALWEKEMVTFRTTCPPGQFLIGVTARQGGWLDALLSITCQSLDDMYRSRKTQTYVNTTVVPVVPFEVTPSADTLIRRSGLSNLQFAGCPIGGSEKTTIMPPGSFVMAFLSASDARVTSLQLFGTMIGFDFAQAMSNTVLGSGTGVGTKQNAACPPGYASIGVAGWAGIYGPGTQPGGSVTLLNNICKATHDDMLASISSLNPDDLPADMIDKCLSGSSDICQVVSQRFAVSGRTQFDHTRGTKFASANPDFMDQAYTLVCGNINSDPNASEADRKICACMMNVAGISSVPGYKPECHNVDCLAGAYKTAAQAAETCEPLTTCIKDLHVDPTTLAKVRLNDQCTAPATPATLPTTTPTVNPTIIIGCVVVLGLIAIFGRRKKNQP